jgi:hypothetical protein
MASAGHAQSRSQAVQRLFRGSSPQQRAAACFEPEVQLISGECGVTNFAISEDCRLSAGRRHRQASSHPDLYRVRSGDRHEGPRGAGGQRHRHPRGVHAVDGAIGCAGRSLTPEGSASGPRPCSHRSGSASGQGPLAFGRARPRGQGCVCRHIEHSSPNAGKVHIKHLKLVDWFPVARAFSP